MESSLMHPLARVEYRLEDDGSVRVAGEDGGWGRFDAEGQWLEGDVRTCDPQMVRWLHSEWAMAHAAGILEGA
jgi:hypothetical protein